MSDDTTSAPTNKSLAGEALAQAKLEELVDDPEPSAHAAVMREVARLQLDNRHLKRQNIRAWSAIAGQALTLFLVIGSAIWWFPKYRYLPTKDNRAVCEADPRDAVPPNAAKLEDFAKEAAVESYTYDYVNYRESIAKVTRERYTERGRKGFLKSLDDSGNLKRLVNGRMIMKAYATGVPQLESTCQDGGRPCWTVHVPVAIEFFVGGSASPASAQDYLAVVRLMEEAPSLANMSGLATDSIALTPTPRRR